MPISPMVEYLAHQTPETENHVGTSDKNCDDPYYFNGHPSSDELFLVTELGQNPNLGVTDAFVAVSHGTHQYVVRASRELGADRLDTSADPCRFEVIEELMKLRCIGEPNEWGVAFDLTFTGQVPDPLGSPSLDVTCIAGTRRARDGPHHAHEARGKRHKDHEHARPHRLREPEPATCP
jgi:hypothetical protein